MKEIENVSIGGFAFALEKDASAAVERYLNGLEAHYLNQEGGKEIMEGIEERMAELLYEKCGRGGVVTLDMVRGVIDILGRPERIEADDPDPDPAQGSPEASPTQEKPRRKLYRDMENKRIGGVCAGLGNYFNFDVTLIRILFCAITVAVFFAGAKDGAWLMLGVIVYVILWIAMPAARTVQERWAMKGDGGTVEDVRRNVRDGVREIGDTARDVVGQARGQGLGKIILIVLGIILLFSGVSGLASVSVISLKGPTLFSGPFDRFLNDFSAESPVLYNLLSTPWVLVLAIFAVVLPLIGLIYLGIRFLFGFKAPKWKPGLVLLVVWLVVVAVLAVLICLGAVSTEYLSA